MIRVTEPAIDCVTAVRRDGERYCFFYRPDNPQAVFRVLCRFAADPELSLTWGDAARMMAAVLARMKERT